MKELTKEVYEQLGVKSLLHPYAKIENVDAKNSSLDYWIRNLSHANWMVGEETKNYIDIMLLYAKAVKVTTKNAVVVASANIDAKRKISTEKSKWQLGTDTHKNLNDIEFEINENNCKEWLEKLTQARTRYSDEYYNSSYKYEIKTQPKEFDITTLNKDNIPDCKKCHGEGFIRCTECDGKKYTVCEHCDGTGSIMYEAGNYADGSERIKSKNCPHCNGVGKIECEECGGTGRIACPSCHGSGKMANLLDCPQIVKYYTDTYMLSKSVDFCIINDWDWDEEHIQYIRSSEDVNEDIDVKWFEPFKLMQLCHYHNKGNKIVFDHSEDVIHDIGKEDMETKKIVKKFLPPKEGLGDRVCLWQNFYSMKDVSIVEITHDVDGVDEEIIFYIHNGYIWGDSYLSYYEKMEKTWKTIIFKIKKFFRIR